MNYTVLVEGQSIPVPEEIGGSDEAVKRALAPFYPEVANAMITRVEKDGTVTVNVVKRAGSKGSGPEGAAYLVTCTGGKNPAVALFEEIQALEADGAVLDPYAMLRMDARIESAISAGKEQADKVDYALKRLRKTAARRSPFVIRGF